MFCFFGILITICITKYHGKTVVSVVKPWLFCGCYRLTMFFWFIFIRANYWYVVAISHETELDWDAFEGQLLM